MIKFGTTQTSAPASARSSPGLQLSREQLSEVRSRRISQKKPSAACHERKSNGNGRTRKVIEQVIAMKQARAVWTLFAKVKYSAIGGSNGRAERQRDRW